MGSNGSEPIRRRRAGTRSINYNEKEADADLIRRIDNMEKMASESKGPNRAGKSKYNKNINGEGINKNGHRGGKNRHQNFLNSKVIDWNFIPSLPPTLRKMSRFSTILDLKDAIVNTSQQTIRNNEGTIFKVNDTIYMVSEPPGDPYYIGRVVEFVPKVEVSQLVEELKDYVSEFPAQYFQIKMNWLYRPRDIREKSSNLDSRLLYASLHEDTCPIISFRGKCTVLHVDEMSNDSFEESELMAKPNLFYFSQLFDRYTLKYYDIMSTENLLKLNSKSSFLNLLNKRFQYIFLEDKYPLEKVMMKYYIKGTADDSQEDQWDERCTVCQEWCVASKRLKCDECDSCVHLYCMDPPLDKKPNKGIIWLCFDCLKRHDGSSEALNELSKEKVKHRENIAATKESFENKARAITKSEHKFRRYWFQYLGRNMVSHMDDILNTDFYIPYPFKNSRTGTKFQWSGCSINEDWRPSQYDISTERGTDNTAEMLWRMDADRLSDNDIEDYIQKCKSEYPPKLEMVPESCNFIDSITKILVDQNYDTSKAFLECDKQLSRQSLREPAFSQTEIENFENSVAQFGSELHMVCKSVKSQPMAMIVRYYYNWKKTQNGKRIWGGFKGRSKNKAKLISEEKEITRLTNRSNSTRKRKPTKLALENQDTQENLESRFLDDSCFDTESMTLVRNCFKCMFCNIDYSPLWYKMSGGSDDEHINNKLQMKTKEKIETNEPKQDPKAENHKTTNTNDRLDALCIRCARLWRRYAVKWQSPLEIFKKLSGNSIHILNSKIDQILEETNPNIVLFKMEQIRAKALEWEQVIDSELILKQRLDLVKTPELFTKLRTNTLASRSALYRLKKKPFDERYTNADYLKKELQDLLSKILHKNKPKNATKNQKSKHDRVDKLKNISNNNSKGKIPYQLLVENYGVCLTGNGDIEIAVEGKGERYGVLLMNKNFDALTVNEKLLASLLSPVTNKRNQSNNENIDTEVLPLKKRKFLNVNSLSEGCGPSYLDVKGQFGDPKIVLENNTRTLLETYHTLCYGNSSSSMSSFDMVSSTNHLKVSQDNHCSVCKISFKDTFQYKLTCRGCGITVHTYCYGVSHFMKKYYAEDPRDSFWICDPCNNDLNPIAPTNYQCVLCCSKTRDQDCAKSQDEGASNDALKYTSSGTWVHVSCAILNTDIKFGSFGSLQPILRIKETLIKNSNVQCKICDKEGGGFVKCDLCEQKYHVFCSQGMPSFTFMFKRFKMSLHAKPTDFNESVSFHDFSHLCPVLICDNHVLNDPDLAKLYFALDSTIGDHCAPLMSLFLSRNNYCREYNTINDRYLEQRTCIDNVSINNVHKKWGYSQIEALRDSEKETESASRIKELLEKKLVTKVYNQQEDRTVSKEDELRNYMTEETLFDPNCFGNIKNILTASQIAVLRNNINPDSFEIKYFQGSKDNKRKGAPKKKITKA